MPGQELSRPGGGTFFVDPNQGGRATRLHLEETFWARLVDVHDVDEQGRASSAAVFRDFAIDEKVQTDGRDYSLETNPITEKTRLVIRRRRGAPDAGLGTFESLLRAAAGTLPAIVPRHEDGSTGGPISFVARNATLVLRFDDVLDDDLEARRDVRETVRVATGYPPRTPFLARSFFDPNHGALVRGEFHSTRVLVDLTVSESESSSLAVPQPLNSLGLPPSLTGVDRANVSVRLPTRVDPGSGQFAVLHGLSGGALDSLGNGPVDLSAPTRDIVRAMRSGNASDLDKGFLLDLRAPEILGSWNLRIDSARGDPAGRAGFDLLLDVTFTTVCRLAPAAGDVVSVGELFLEVVQRGDAPDADGAVHGLRVRAQSDGPVGSALALLGNARFLSTYQTGKPVSPACWLGFAPLPAELPAAGVSTSARLTVRFSEPMDPRSLASFEGFSLVRGEPFSAPSAGSLVVGELLPSADLRSFTFRPVLPLVHSTGAAETYHTRLDGPTDLAGNGLSAALAHATFHLAPAQPTVSNGSTVLRFDSADELEPLGFPDLRGQCLFDFQRGLIRPRPVASGSYPADRTNPVPSIMIPFAPGVQTPLNALGSKLQMVWRYCDFGWQVLDETKYNLDVLGLAWAPRNGALTSDYFEGFEIRLAHSSRQPDEVLDVNRLPRWPDSGLVRQFELNVLGDPLSPQKVVHPRGLGYRISPTDLFLASSGTVMLSFPVNRALGAPVTYTWRDTAVLALGGQGGNGIPLDIEAGPLLGLEDKPGYVAAREEVPSFGLPLLIEVRCFPSSRALGLNPLDVSLAVNTSALPAFRAYSSGGVDESGATVQRDPDAELVGRGGFNPGSSPPGKPTIRPDDNAFYIGQLDVATRISRVHTVWIDTQFAAARFVEPILVPPSAEQPDRTRILVDYRGAQGFELGDLDVVLGRSVDESSYPFDARRLNAYGDIYAIVPVNRGTVANPNIVDTYETLGADHFPGGVRYAGGTPVWSDDIASVAGARYLQLRITFESDLATGTTPELSAIGIAWSDR